MHLLTHWGLSKRRLTEVQIARDLTKQLKIAYPDLTIDLQQTGNIQVPLKIDIRQSDQHIGVLYPAQLYAFYKSQNASTFAEYLNELVDNVHNSLPCADTPIENELLLPVIQNTAWLSEYSLNYQQPAYMPLAGDLLVTFTLTCQHQLSYVNYQELAEHSPENTLDNLYNLAFENLQLLEIPLEISHQGACYQLRLDSLHDNCLAILPHLWQNQIKLQGLPVLALPARDQLLLADSANPESVAQLREHLNGLFLENLHPLSKNLYTYNSHKELIILT